MNDKHKASLKGQAKSRLIVSRRFTGRRRAADALLPVIADDIAGKANRTIDRSATRQ
jgi:hypothetical protein